MLAQKIDEVIEFVCKEIKEEQLDVQTQKGLIEALACLINAVGVDYVLYQKSRTKKEG